MSVVFLLYLAHVLGNISAFFQFVMILSAFVFVGTAILCVAASLDNCHEYVSKIKPIFKWSTTVFLVSLPLYSFIPDKETMYLLIGVHYGEYALTSEEARSLGGKGMEYLHEYLDRELEELRNKEE